MPRSLSAAGNGSENHHQSEKDRSEHILEDQLRRYTDSGVVPMHMPGHKRRCQTSGMVLSGHDLTEVEGVDDLHNAAGILKEAMDRTAALYGADRTWYLVGGSTCGILAGIRACVSYEDEIIAARNCHRSVYHAVELLNLTVHWILPETDPVSGIFGSVQPERVQEMIRRYPTSRTVILTSPTYEGVISDIGTIADICHSNGQILMVDEAHGAHLGLFPEGGFPDGALRGGADLVVQSPHKTLLSVTQTAWLHLKGNRVDAGRVERALDIFETSSPSYPLMTSLDGCTGILSHRGRELFARWNEFLHCFDEEISTLRTFAVIGHDKKNGPARELFYRFDRSKIPVYSGEAGMTGAELEEILRRRYRIETEMSCGMVTLAMTGAGDAFGAYRNSGLHRLASALCETDERICAFAEKHSLEICQTSAQSKEEREDCIAGRWNYIEADRTIADALRIADTGGTEEVFFEQAEGRVCAEYIYSYPPGIPFLAPGETVTREMLDLISRLEMKGTRMYRENGRLEKIRCLKEY